MTDPCTEYLDFDWQWKEVRINIQREPYVLREASGDAMCKYRNSLTSGAIIKDGKPAGVGSIADAAPLLVALCLFKLNLDNEGKELNREAVSVTVVRSWPHKVQEALFDKVRAISNMDEDEDKTKNSSTGTMDGSP